MKNALGVVRAVRFGSLEKLLPACVILCILAACSGEKLQQGIYLSRDATSYSALLLDASGNGEFRLVYVDPGSPAIHRVSYGLHQVGRDGQDTLMSAARGMDDCGTIRLRRAEGPLGILILRHGDVEQAYSPGSREAMAANDADLQHISKLQSEYPGRAPLLDHPLLLACR